TYRKKMSSSRRHHLKSLMISIAKNLLDAEKTQTEADRVKYMDDNCPALSMPGSVQDLQELCKKLHQQIDKIDEERYDLETKANKGSKEIEDLRIKIQDLKGKFKKPALRKALLGSKHTVNLDLRANLKQVKKEVREEEKEAVGDWRKNIEDKAGMGGRKKMFESDA
uniref:Troponin I2, fast skeletal type n=1 Tax=Paramormyrops kingsleyae TaxID=1676925 RepID=A0A3B3RDS3_9TELE